MEKNRIKFVPFLHGLGLIGFTIMALASSSAGDLVKDKDFQDGFKQGWEIGKSLSDDTTPEMMPTETDSVSVNSMDMAINL